MIYIYTLSSSSDPNNIRYIGKAKDIKTRLRRHTGKYYLNSESNYKNNWIKSELNKGNEILISELDKASDTDWEYWERYWIDQFKNWGFKLTNTTDGGDGIPLTEDIVNRRGSTRIKNNLIKIKEEIDKFKITEMFDCRWMGERECPSCKRKILHTSKTRNKILNLIRKSVSRNCISCARKENSAFKGRKWDNKKMKERYSKGILQYKGDELVNEFDSIRDASKSTGIDRKSISNCAKGVKWYTTAGGYIFKYK